MQKINLRFVSYEDFYFFYSPFSINNKVEKKRQYIILDVGIKQ